MKLDASYCTSNFFRELTLSFFQGDWLTVLSRWLFLPYIPTEKTKKIPCYVLLLKADLHEEKLLRILTGNRLVANLSEIL